MLKSGNIYILVFSFLLLLNPGNSQAESWKVHNTRYLELNYQSLADLEKFGSKIKYSKDSGEFLSFFSSSSGNKKGYKEKLSVKLDSLCEKIQLILDMRKPFKVKINIYSGKAALHDAYFQIYKKKTKMRAWYIFEYNTIYVNNKDLFSGMLAHEIAHAIIDNYLAARPPRATAEILARYVDKHLHEKVKTY